MKAGHEGKRIARLLDFYQWLTWSMRLISIPLIAGCIYTTINDYRELVLHINDTETLLSLLGGILCSIFSLAIFIAAWTSGWEREDDNS